MHRSGYYGTFLWIVLWILFLGSDNIIGADVNVFSLDGKWINSNSRAGCVPRGSFTVHGCCESQSVFQMRSGIIANGSMHTILNFWRHKVISLSGDSLTQQTYDAIVVALTLEKIAFSETSTHYICDEKKDCVVLSPELRCGVNHQSLANQCNNVTSKQVPNFVPCNCSVVYHVQIPSYGITINYLYSYKMFLPTKFWPLMTLANVGFNAIHYQLFESYTRLSDMMIVNVGLHYHQLSGALFSQVLRYVRSILEEDKGMHPHKRHIYRLTFPTHFGRTGLYDAWNRSDGCYQRARSAWTAEAARGMMGENISILDYDNVMKRRGDLHSRKRLNGDCAHWCYSYELFYPFFQLISKILMSP